MQTREELIKELKEKFTAEKKWPCLSWNDLADLIIQDRLRVVEPLIKSYDDINFNDKSPENVIKAIELVQKGIMETLTNAGVQNESR
jgi:hypothetical protein